MLANEYISIKTKTRRTATRNAFNIYIIISM